MVSSSCEAPSPGDRRSGNGEVSFLCHPAARLDGHSRSVEIAREHFTEIEQADFALKGDEISEALHAQ